jgi:hypothetical protein
MWSLVRVCVRLIMISECVRMGVTRIELTVGKTAMRKWRVFHESPKQEEVQRHNTYSTSQAMTLA